MDGPVRTASRGVWCGPVSPHFGHMIDDFVSHVRRSIDEADGMALVFILGPEVGLEPKSFFRQILGHLGASESHVLPIREPTASGRCASSGRRGASVPGRAAAISTCSTG